jgi:excisionase family DNA binding protein
MGLPESRDDHSITARLLLTIPELAAELRVVKRTVYRLLKAGQLPLQIVHIGHSPRVRRVDVEAYLERLATDAADAQAAQRAALGVWMRRGRRV